MAAGGGLAEQRHGSGSGANPCLGVHDLVRSRARIAQLDEQQWALPVVTDYVIRPLRRDQAPADLRALCPDAQPDGLAEPAPALRPAPMYYLWDHRAWQWQRSSPGFVPDTAAFTPANNRRALQFALRAIQAQPAAYLSVVAHDSVQPFTDTNDLRFPVYQPSTATLDPGDQRYTITAITAYTGTTQGIAHDLGYRFGTRLRSPYAALMNQYQHVIFLPGPVLALAVLAGLAGCLMPRRRTAQTAFLWTSAVILMILPTAEHEYTQRYVIPAVPLVCIAAALALRRPAKQAPAQPPPTAAPTGVHDGLAMLEQPHRKAEHRSNLAIP